MTRSPRSVYGAKAGMQFLHDIVRRLGFVGDKFANIELEAVEVS